MPLEMAIEDALFRIKRDYERTEGKIYLSFSGGKDSTVLAHLIMMAELPTEIPFLFVNTGIELDATLRFVKNFPYGNVVISKPRKPFAQVITEYGKPCLSKLKSEALSTYQNHIDEPLKTARAYQLITGTRLKGGKPIEGRNSYKLANKHMHFIHPSTEFKVANKCCQYMKKYPFQDFEKQNNMNGSFSGVRASEGGARSMAYDSCVKIKRKGDKEEFVMSMPIIDWTDQVMDEFIEKFEVKLSDAYEVYGCTRTGCCACPYSQNLSEELRLLHNFEPLKYRAMMHWMKDVYMYQLIECSYDEQYSAEYAVRKKEIEQRRSEMMNKFRPKIK